MHRFSAFPCSSVMLVPAGAPREPRYTPEYEPLPSPAPVGESGSSKSLCFFIFINRHPTPEPTSPLRPAEEKWGSAKNSLTPILLCADACTPWHCPDSLGHDIYPVDHMGHWDPSAPLSPWTAKLCVALLSVPTLPGPMPQIVWDLSRQLQQGEATLRGGRCLDQQQTGPCRPHSCVHYYSV